MGNPVAYGKQAAAVIGYPHGPGMVAPDVKYLVEVVAGLESQPSTGSNPKTPRRVFVERKHRSVGQACRGCILRYTLAHQPIQARSARTDPDSSVLGAVHGVDQIAG